jgi:inositol polyphosphate 1-phosphatase
MVHTEMIVTSVAALLEQCVLSAIAARQFVHANFLQRDASGSMVRAGDGALGVQVKGKLALKNGAQDLVTAADIAVQELIVTALTAPCYTSRFATRRDSGSSAPSYEIVGEEEDASMQGPRQDEIRESRLQKYSVYLARAEETSEFRHLSSLLRAPGRETEDANGRIAIFIDPIDATVAFVEGCRVAPMTLIGIARDGLPVAGVATRLFADAARRDPDVRNAIPEYMSVCLAGGPCILWGNEVRRPRGNASAAPLDAALPLRVAFSDSTTDGSLAGLMRAISPVEKHPARGGGNKSMMVAQMAAAASGGADLPASPSAAPPVHVFPALRSLCKWDTCAPHAFLRSLGGDMYQLPWSDVGTPRAALTPLRYDDHAATKYSIDAGNVMLAVASSSVAVECLRRLQTSRSNL